MCCSLFASLSTKRMLLYCFFSILLVFAPVSSVDDSSYSSGDGSSSTLQNVNHVLEYVHTLRRTQDELFRKIFAFVQLLIHIDLLIDHWHLFRNQLSFLVDRASFGASLALTLIGSIVSIHSLSKKLKKCAFFNGNLLICLGVAINALVITNKVIPFFPPEPDKYYGYPKDYVEDCEAYPDHVFKFYVKPEVLKARPVMEQNEPMQAAGGAEEDDDTTTEEIDEDMKEVTEKIDWLTKVVEEKDREDHKFRVKFSRKVHTLENKVLYLEQTFTQKVEEIVERKLIQLNEQLRHYNSYQTVAEPNLKYSKGSSSSHDDESIENDDGASIQNHPPSPSSPYSIGYPHQQQSPYHQHHIRHQPPYRNNWGFYEHPITHKKVRDGNIFKYEPPTRDLPLISLVATATPTLQKMSDVKGQSSSIGTVSRSSPSVEGKNGIGAPTEFITESQKRFESLEMTLKLLRENVTNLEREISKGMLNDKSDLQNVLVENAREIMSLHQKHKEMVQRIEHFTVEMEKAAAKREHAVNESIKELSSDLKKQISSVKGYTKRQIQNLTAMSATNQAPDRTRCAQSLLDELMTQMNQPKNRYPVSPSSTLIQTDLIADQAQTEDENEEMGKLSLFTGRKLNRREATEKLEKELELQRKEIMELKSEIARLNISQILLMRTVDEETLKRTVRPRDCSEIRLLRNVSSGIFSIFPWMNDVSVDVYCDMTTEGGGWTVIQRRGELLEDDQERESFFRGWEEYEEGFGQKTGDFWLGLSNIAALCQLGIQELRIDMSNWSGESRYANYQYFRISNANDKYRINVSSYSGTAGDSLSRHNDMAFSTPDRDNDADPRRHCAKTYFSGWWYYACFESNLNGIYVDESDKNSSRAFGTGIIWQHWMGHYSSLKHVEMKIRNTFIGDNQYLKRIF